MASLIERGSGLLREFAARLRARREDWPIDSVSELQRFAHTRAAFVAQKTLYGYLKTRIGTRYPRMFEEPAFVNSVNIAKMEVFAACLSDLTVHVVARAAANSAMEPPARARAADECYAAGLAAAADHISGEGDLTGWARAFSERASATQWENVAAGGNAFTLSPPALVRWAPIAEELKRHDAPIVKNSVRYAWNEVIRDFRLRCDAKALQVEMEPALRA